MRATTRFQGRFVSTYGLKKIAGAPGSRYQLISLTKSATPFHTSWNGIAYAKNNQGPMAPDAHT